MPEKTNFDSFSVILKIGHNFKIFNFFQKKKKLKLKLSFMERKFKKKTNSENSIFYWQCSLNKKTEEIFHPTSQLLNLLRKREKNAQKSPDEVSKEAHTCLIRLIYFFFSFYPNDILFYFTDSSQHKRQQSNVTVAAVATCARLTV